MEVPLITTTNPITITRLEAAKIIKRTTTMVDKAIAADKIDYGKTGRHIRVVINQKWKDYLEYCNDKDHQRQNKKP